MTDARSAGDVDDRVVAAGGVRWRVAVGGRGPALLLLHGTGASRRSFDALLPLLAPTFRVVAPDLPGHASTSMPASGDLSIDGMAAALVALLAALDVEPAVAVGHSAGAAIVARMTLDRQIRPAALVGLNAALLPLDGAARILSPMARIMASLPGLPRLVSGMARDDRAVRRLVDSTGSTIDDEGTRRYAALVRDPRHVAGALAMMAAWNLDRTWAELPRLDPAPLLVVGAADRTVSPRQADRVVARVPGTETLVLPGLGHLAHEEAPGPVAAAIVGHARRRGVVPLDDARPAGGSTSRA